MISLADILGILGIIVLPEMVNYLFRSRLLDVVGDVAESVNVFFHFFLKRNTHT